MRTRPAARLLVIDSQKRVLLFKFTHSADALAGLSYWATPGGGVEPGETFVQAAIRELQEETGIVRHDVGECIAQRKFAMRLPNGELVTAVEKFYVVQVTSNTIDKSDWSSNEKNVIGEHHWWSIDELMTTQEVIYPQDIAVLLAELC